MKFETVKNLDDEKFRRLTGVKRPTFDKIVGIRLLSKSALGAEADDFSADFCSKGGGHSRKARRRTEVKKLPESAVYAANEISKELYFVTDQ